MGHEKKRGRERERERERAIEREGVLSLAYCSVGYNAIFALSLDAHFFLMCSEPPAAAASKITPAPPAVTCRFCVSWAGSVKHQLK